MVKLCNSLITDYQTEGYKKIFCRGRSNINEKKQGPKGWSLMHTVYQIYEIILLISNVVTHRPLWMCNNLTFVILTQQPSPTFWPSKPSESPSSFPKYNTNTTGYEKYMLNSQRCSIIHMYNLIIISMRGCWFISNFRQKNTKSWVHMANEQQHSTHTHFSLVSLQSLSCQKKCSLAFHLLLITWFLMGKRCACTVYC